MVKLERLVWKIDGFFNSEGRRVNPEPLGEPITVKVKQGPKGDEERTNRLIEIEAERHSEAEAIAFSAGVTPINTHDFYAIQYFKQVNREQGY